MHDFNAVLLIVQDQLSGDTWTRTVTIASAILVGAKWIVSKFTAFHSDFLMIVTEHEILMQDYCARKSITLSDLATRSQNRTRTKAVGAD